MNKEISVSIVTNHGKERVFKRVGGRKNSSQKIVDKAYIEGITMIEATGQLKEYLFYLYNSYEKKADNIKVYNRKVYLFTDNILITVLNLPSELHKVEDALKRKRAKKEQENKKEMVETCERLISI